MVVISKAIHREYAFYFQSTLHCVWVYFSHLFCCRLFFIETGGAVHLCAIYRTAYSSCLLFFIIVVVAIVVVNYSKMARVKKNELSSINRNQTNGFKIVNKLRTPANRLTRYLLAVEHYCCCLSVSFLLCFRALNSLFNIYIIHICQNCLFCEIFTHFCKFSTSNQYTHTQSKSYCRRCFYVAATTIVSITFRCFCRCFVMKRKVLDFFLLYLFSLAKVFTSAAATVKFPSQWCKRQWQIK